MTFEQELSALLNRRSLEHGSNTPDFVLAEYLFACLSAFNNAIRVRERWHGGASLPDPENPTIELSTIEETTIRHVRAVMIACDGNKSEAARVLGIDRRSLYRYLEKAGLHKTHPRRKSIGDRDDYTVEAS